eukprot:CAMPEP_0117017230 /NCGR_PEP_ID=MMETSP0472-20121206/13485_1 /TAXON_ID=693140 ORGANISM="Tiarina fusus, Strain LIS" /NCGR_SAMPLE_ID=MMETSP0472 /ASSEMBLY_ACC=CAM_ASM_000603 /LENGTH=123 /DNA_ID=CAMNT_0004721541 /DNA_START=125 /DNA_END=496 /DNA_ORIENTATION=+
MPFTELNASDELTEFIQEHEVCLVTFSATWCGPCKRSKPELEAMAPKNPDVPFGYVYEHDLEEDDFLNTFTTIFCKGSITGFPTYICFVGGAEVQRVNGVKLDEVQAMITAHRSNNMGEKNQS